MTARSKSGIGYDVHRLEQGRRLVLGGVDIAHARGLAGHSDADVLSHALADALLGAMALGDIGRHFPPGADETRDMSSMVILERVAKLVAAAGGRTIHVDATIIAEEPRLAPHIDAMRANVSAALGIELEQVSIKATTHEGVGALGRREAIAAMAVATIEA